MRLPRKAHAILGSTVLAELQHEPSTRQRLLDILALLDAEEQTLAAIYVGMALDRLDHRPSPSGTTTVDP